MHKECKLDLCASLGFLTKEQFHRLHEAGVTSYHDNIGNITKELSEYMYNSYI